MTDGPETPRLKEILDLEPIKARHVPNGEHPDDAYEHFTQNGYDDDYIDMWSHASQDIGALIAEVERLRDVPVMAETPRLRALWQPIETAPKHQAVLVFYEQYGEALTARRGERGWSVAGLSEHYIVQPPTHWMPLPEPPGVLVRAGAQEPAQGEGTIFTDSPGTMEITRSPVVLAATSAGAAPEVHVGHCVCAECQVIDAKDNVAAPEANWVKDVQALVDKLDVIIPIVDGYIALSHIRSGGQYQGPNLVKELAAVKALLAAHGAGRPQKDQA